MFLDVLKFELTYTFRRPAVYVSWEAPKGI